MNINNSANISKAAYGTTTQTDADLSTHDSLSVGMEMLADSGSDYDIRMDQVHVSKDEFAETGDGDRYPTGNKVWTPINAFTPVRDDTEKPVSHRTVGKGYQVIQNREVISMFDEICRDHSLTYNYMSSLKKGAGFCVQVTCPELNRALKVGADDHKGLMTGINFHDGRSSYIIMSTVQRLVCDNVLPSLLREAKNGKGAKNTHRVRHSTSMEERLNDIIAEFRTAMDDMSNTGRVLNLLSQTACTAAAQDELFKRVIAAAGPSEVTKVEEERQLAVFGDLQDRSKMSVNRAIGLEGSWYAAMQPLTHYGTHGKIVKSKRSDSAKETRFLSALNGNGAKFSTLALDLAIEMSGVSV
jgi:hypothetical protein